MRAILIVFVATTLWSGVPTTLSSLQEIDGMDERQRELILRGRRADLLRNIIRAGDAGLLTSALKYFKYETNPTHFQDLVRDVAYAGTLENQLLLAGFFNEGRYVKKDVAFGEKLVVEAILHDIERFSNFAAPEIEATRKFLNGENEGYQPGESIRGSEVDLFIGTSEVYEVEFPQNLADVFIWTVSALAGGDQEQIKAAKQIRDGEFDISKPASSALRFLKLVVKGEASPETHYLYAKWLRDPEFLKRRYAERNLREEDSDYEALRGSDFYDSGRHLTIAHHAGYAPATKTAFCMVDRSRPEGSDEEAIGSESLKNSAKYQLLLIMKERGIEWPPGHIEKLLKEIPSDYRVSLLERAKVGRDFSSAFTGSRRTDLFDCFDIP